VFAKNAGWGVALWLNTMKNELLVSMAGRFRA